VARAIEAVATYLGRDAGLVAALIDRGYRKGVGDTDELGVAPFPDRSAAAELAAPVVDQPALGEAA